MTVIGVYLYGDLDHKVRVEIEYIGVAEPVPLGEFDTIEEAVAEVERVTGEPPGWSPLPKREGR